jgi:hypothetical protein
MRARAVSVREEGAAYRFGVLAMLGRGWIRGWAGLVPLGPFLFSLFLFFFYFPDFWFYSFANLVQINSNKILKSSNIQHNVSNQ